MGSTLWMLARRRVLVLNPMHLNSCFALKTRLDFNSCLFRWRNKLTGPQPPRVYNKCHSLFSRGVLQANCLGSSPLLCSSSSAMELTALMLNLVSHIKSSKNFYFLLLICTKLNIYSSKLFLFYGR